MSELWQLGALEIGDRFTDLRCPTVAAEIDAMCGVLTPIDPVSE